MFPLTGCESDLVAADYWWVRRNIMVLDGFRRPACARNPGATALIVLTQGLGKCTEQVDRVPAHSAFKWKGPGQEGEIAFPRNPSCGLCRSRCATMREVVRRLPVLGSLLPDHVRKPAVPHSPDEIFLPIAGIVFSEEGYVATLQFVVDTACAYIAGASMAGMTLLDGGGPTTAVATSTEAGRVDALQYLHNGGPCLEAYRRQAVIRIESTDSDERWPEFCRGALETGIHSTLSFPLIVNGDGLGALNRYSEHQSGFDDIDERTGGLFAAHASVTLANAQAAWKNDALRRNLEEALKTRGVIDQAKGILMVEQKISADEAFEVLKRASQRSNRKVNDLAQEIVDRRGQSMDLDR
jgi:hypothetical protein